MKNLHTYLAISLCSVISLTVRAQTMSDVQAMSDVRLPRVWNAAFIELLCEMAPNQNIVITVLMHGDDFLVSMSRTGTQEKWYAFHRTSGRLQEIDSKKIEIKLGEKQATVTYGGNVYIPVHGFSLYRQVQVEDYER